MNRRKIDLQKKTHKNFGLPKLVFYFAYNFLFISLIQKICLIEILANCYRAEVSFNTQNKKSHKIFVEYKQSILR